MTDGTKNKGTHTNIWETPKTVYREMTQIKTKQKYYYDRHARHLKEMVDRRNR